MDFRIYAALLDPVLVLTDDGYIQFANFAAMRWLSVQVGEELVGKRLDEYIFLNDVALLSLMSTIKPWEFSDYAQTMFEMPKHGYQNVAKITIQCIPVEPDILLYALIIRDKVFTEALWEEDRLKLDSHNHSLAPPTPFEAPPVEAPKLVLDTETLMKAMPKELTSQMNERVILTVPMLRLNLKCQAIMISEEWIDMMVKSPAIKSGLRCTMELIGSNEIQAFTCAAFVESYKLDNGDVYMGRFKFDNISASARKIITTYLEKNAIRI
jgi:hypothetical protein